MLKFFKDLFRIIILIVLLAAIFISVLTIAEFKPDAVERAPIQGASLGKKVPAGETFSLISWNIGYGALGKECDFVMDGGKGHNADEALVEKYVSGISATLKANDASVYMLQEVDVDSKRSFNTDEREGLYLGQGVHALNYSCLYVPFPWPPLGKVNSGIFTTTEYEIESAERISLPCPFSWPLRIANLKRCLLVSRLPVEGSSKELVLVNLHLEAYDDGDGKIAQTNQLVDFIRSEFSKGNYVIAGGDFNQTFPGTLNIYPNTHAENWEPGTFENSSIPAGWTFAFDNTTPSCRLLNQPYDPADTAGTQYYVIDGFIVSPNVQIDDVKTLDEGFVNSDHNPVKLSVTLLPENGIAAEPAAPAEPEIVADGITV